MLRFNHTIENKKLYLLRENFLYAIVYKAQSNTQGSFLYIREPEQSGKRIKLNKQTIQVSLTNQPTPTL